MSGVPIHTQDPISPAKAKTTTGSHYTYPAAQPGAAAPTPTSRIPHSSSNGPPAPQPRAAPVPPPPTITARPSVPPPPKAGERPLSPKHYAPVQSTPAQPQQYPSQMSQSPVDRPLRAVPPGSTTSTNVEPSFNPSSQPSHIPSSTDMPPRASLEHPPGYVQNPFASDMTPEQRFAAQQEHENSSDTLPSLGYVDNSKGPGPGLEEDQSVLGTAMKWAKETKQLGEEVWNKYGPDR